MLVYDHWRLNTPLTCAPITPNGSRSVTMSWTIFWARDAWTSAVMPSCTRLIPCIETASSIHSWRTCFVQSTLKHSCSRQNAHISYITVPVAVWDFKMTFLNGLTQIALLNEVLLAVLSLPIGHEQKRLILGEILA